MRVCCFTLSLACCTQLIYLCLLDSLTDEESRKNWEDYGNPDGPEGNNPFLSSPTSCAIHLVLPPPPTPPPHPPSTPFVLMFYFSRVSWCLICHLRRHNSFVFHQLISGLLVDAPSSVESSVTLEQSSLLSPKSNTLLSQHRLSVPSRPGLFSSEC